MFLQAAKVILFIEICIMQTSYPFLPVNGLVPLQNGKPSLAFSKGRFSLLYIIARAASKPNATTTEIISARIPP